MKLEFDKSKNQKIKLPCVDCDNETYHKILTSVNKSDSDEYTAYYEQNQIVICQGCEKISFRSNWQFSEDEECDCSKDPTTGDFLTKLADHITLYPSRITGRRELKNVHYLPSEIYKIYKEIYSALCSGMSVLSGVGIRILVESICNDKEASGNNLEKKIDDLIDIGILTKEGAEILHGTRLLGNQAAHEAKLIDEKTLNAAKDVVEHLLIGAYILPKKTKSLPKRR